MVDISIYIEHSLRSLDISNITLDDMLLTGTQFLHQREIRPANINLPEFMLKVRVFHSFFLILFSVWWFGYLLQRIRLHKENQNFHTPFMYLVHGERLDTPGTGVCPHFPTQLWSSAGRPGLQWVLGGRVVDSAGAGSACFAVRSCNWRL